MKNKIYKIIYFVNKQLPVIMKRTDPIKNKDLVVARGTVKTSNNYASMIFNKLINFTGMKFSKFFLRHFSKFFLS